MIPTNKRVVATQPGGLEQLQMQEEPLPEPQPTEVRVRVLAAGVAYGDVMLFGAAAATQSPGSFMLGILGTMLRLLLLKLRPDGRQVALYTITAKANKVSVQADLLKMVQWLSEGKISPIIAKILPLSQAAEAHRLLEETRPVGKIVLEP